MKTRIWLCCFALLYLRLHPLPKHIVLCSPNGERIEWRCRADCAPGKDLTAPLRANERCGEEPTPR